LKWVLTFIPSSFVLRCWPNTAWLICRIYYNVKLMFWRFVNCSKKLFEWQLSEWQNTGILKSIWTVSFIGRLILERESQNSLFLTIVFNRFFNSNFLTVIFWTVIFWTVIFWTVIFWTVIFWTVGFWTVVFQVSFSWIVSFQKANQIVNTSMFFAGNF
jgi:hypothetical protein